MAEVNLRSIRPGDGVGPMIPLDARVIARLPLRVMRRILPPDAIDPDHRPVLEAYEAEAHSRLDLTEAREWVRGAELGGRTAYELKDENPCDHCDSDGGHYHRGVWYECAECDGAAGKVSVAEVIIDHRTLDLTIIEERMKGC